MSQAAGPGPAHAQNSGHKVRRPRAARACNLCRLKKNKCDELYPCTYCRNRNVECVYQGQNLTRGRYTPEYVRGLEEQIRELSASLESQRVSQAGHGHHAADGSSPALSGLAAKSSHSQGSPGTDVGFPSSPIRAKPGAAAGQEVTAINKHTRNVEFYGSSSSVALLSQLHRTHDQQPHDGNDTGSDGHSESDAAAAVLLSNLHNPAFSPPEADQGAQPISPQSGLDKQASVVELTHYRQCSVFLHNFFSSIHYIHPILDKTSFLERCEILWSGDENAVRQVASFVPLYYSVLSLGALVGYRDAEPVGGFSNQKWSRKFFNEARLRFTQLEIVTDLEMVQCYFFLAKVCQNELNSHWSYFYTGLAGRTALAMGINRQPPPNTKKSYALLKAESRTWWGLYSLEEELSFAMGRPSSLGSDDYHNRDFPHTEVSELPQGNLALLEPPHCAIIKSMVDFSRITRHVGVKVYLTQNTAARTVELASQIDGILGDWLANLPENIRLHTSEQSMLSSSKEAIWMKRQKLVLNIRYLNIRILLFGSILLTSTHAERAHIPGSYEGIQTCLDSAKRTIEIIYETYKHHEFFRTWFYNTTYTIFAASIILVYINQEASEVEIEPLLRLVSMSIEVLETMADECFVAGRSSKLLQKAMERAAAARHQKDSERLAGTLMSMSAAAASVSAQQQHQHQQQHQQRQQPQHGYPGGQQGQQGQGHRSDFAPGGGGGVSSAQGAHAALTPAESDHDGGGGGGGGGGSGAQQAMPWPDPAMGFNWMQSWAPVNLLDGEMLDFDLNMPFMGFETGDGGMNPRPG